MKISDLVPLILDLKDHYNTVRPDELASMKGISFRSDFLETAQSPLILVGIQHRRFT